MNKKLYSVAVGNAKPWRKKSREAINYIASLDGFAGFYPCYPHGTFCFFDDLNKAKIARNMMNLKGIATGRNIYSFIVGADGVPVLYEVDSK